MTARARSVLLLALAALGCGDGSTDGADPCAGKSRVAGTREVFLSSGGRERRFVLVVPPSALDGGPAPLVLGFHGALSNPEQWLAVTRFPEKAAEEGFVIAAGAGIERTWNAGACCDPAASLGVDDVAFTRDVIAAVEEELCIDASRIFATGFSNGGAMSFRLACEVADRLAATAPAGGALATRCEPERALPILIVNNVEDPIVPFVLGEVAFDQFLGFNTCGPERRTREPAANAVCESAPDCEEGATTEFCAVSGISHVWPGGATDPDGAFDATEAIWDFFATVAP